jgi:hypothetical protein
MEPDGHPATREPGRPKGGRREGVFTMGFRLDATKATGRRSASGMWAWSEADARRLVEEAGFAEVSVTYERVTGADRLDEVIQRAFVGSYDMRLVLGVKPR